jgi:hypothetical protein
MNKMTTAPITNIEEGFVAPDRTSYDSAVAYLEIIARRSRRANGITYYYFNASGSESVRAYEGERTIVSHLVNEEIRKEIRGILKI